MVKNRYAAIPKPLVLAILDGWGVKRRRYGNAIAVANTPEMTRILNECPHTLLMASGSDVGLPPRVMGNSEVGHLNIGAGRVVPQDLVRINNAIKESRFASNRVLLKVLRNAKVHNSSIHLLGLLSDGGVHSHIRHLFALLTLVKRHNITKVYVHPFLDGRDTPPASASKYLMTLEKRLSQLKIGRIATIMGRYYSMDRDNRWDRTAKAYFAIALGCGLKASSAYKALKNAYKRGETDEFVQPTVIGSYSGMADSDSAIFFNFRSDRPRQLVRSFIEKKFNSFDRKMIPKIHLACMTEYDRLYGLPVAFPPLCIKNGLGEVISQAGLKQLRIAESEKYAHVTFFFNGGKEKPYSNEDRILVPSPKVATYDLQPEMSAFEVTRILVKQIRSRRYDFILVNYANPDMVAHTGNFSATVKAVEAVDKCISEIVAATNAVGGLCIVMADHGHAEEMLDYHTGKPRTAHTLSPVPFILVSNKRYRLKPGRLADVGPTILYLMQIKKPKEMTGNLLLRSKRIL